MFVCLYPALKAKEAELSKTVKQAFADRQEQLTLLRDRAGFEVQMAQKTARVQSLERDVEQHKEQHREADARVEALRVKNEALRQEVSPSVRQSVGSLSVYLSVCLSVCH